MLSWVGPEKTGAPVDIGVKYNLSKRPSETPLAKVGEEIKNVAKLGRGL